MMSVCWGSRLGPQDFHKTNLPPQQSQSLCQDSSHESVLDVVQDLASRPELWTPSDPPELEQAAPSSGLQAIPLSSSP